MFQLLVLLFSICIASSGAFLTPRLQNNHHLFASSNGVEMGSDPSKGTDLTNHGLWCTVNGFGAEGANCALLLQPNFQVEFTKGISSDSPGFWRVITMTDGSEIFEATHPVVPEYMFFFDIWEATILWRGTLDKKAMKIQDGQVLTNKKRFGLWPYTEVIATFTADLYTPEEKLPEVELPMFKDLRFDPPEGFETPYDMKSFPEIFSPEFADWWFEVEQALGKGQEPPPRPKAVFLPNPSAKTGGSPDELNDIKAARSTANKGSGASTASGTAFGKKKQ